MLLYSLQVFQRVIFLGTKIRDRVSEYEKVYHLRRWARAFTDLGNRNIMCDVHPEVRGISISEGGRQNG